jgi:hypothetical protein
VLVALHLCIDSWTLFVLVLQRVFRGKRARYAANIIRRRHHGALAYQRVYRGYLGRCVTWGRRLRCRAAKVLQVSESGLSRARSGRVLDGHTFLLERFKGLTDSAMICA